KDLHIFAGELRDVVERHGRRLANWFFHVPDILWQEILELLRRDGHFEMPAAELVGSQLGVGAFVGKLLALEANRVCIHALARLFDHEAQQRSGIDAAAKQTSDGYAG